MSQQTKTGQLNVPAEILKVLCDYSDDLGALNKRDGKLPADAAVAALLSLIEQVGKEIIGEDEEESTYNPDDGDLLSEDAIIKNELRDAQRQTLATILGKDSWFHGDGNYTFVKGEKDDH